MTRKLKASEVAGVRAEQLVAQHGRCAICSLPVKRPCLDHNHSTGAIRGTLCSGCNAVLGKIENSYHRYGVQNLSAFLNGCAGYLHRHAVNLTGMLHPSHKTEEEKRERRNAKARKSRAAAKTG